MRVRASLVVTLIAAVVTTMTPADAASPRISVDNVDSLRVVDTYDLGEARAYRFALDRRSMADGSLLWTGLSMPQFFESSGGVLYGTRFDFTQQAPLRLVAFDAATGRELAEYPANYDSVVTPERYLMHAGEGVFDVYEPTR